MSFQIITGKAEATKRIAPFQTKAKISPEDYALTQEENTVSCAISMIQEFNGLLWAPTIAKVSREGLVVPRVLRFITQYKNVSAALQGKGAVYGASGNLIEGDKLEAYAHRLNHNCWVHLNDSFEEGQGFLGLDLVTIVGLDEKGNPIIKREYLEDCLEEDCWAELESLNAQGFPTKRAEIQKYEPGKVVYFLFPRPDSVVWFIAGRSRASLDCYRDRRHPYAYIGAFPCAEGAEKN